MGAGQIGNFALQLSLSLAEFEQVWRTWHKLGTQEIHEFVAKLHCSYDWLQITFLIVLKIF